MKEHESLSGYNGYSQGSHNLSCHNFVFCITSMYPYCLPIDVTFHEKFASSLILKTLASLFERNNFLLYWKTKC